MQFVDDAVVEGVVGAVFEVVVNEGGGANEWRPSLDLRSTKASGDRGSADDATLL